jgi:hypothetical protein
MNGQHSTSLNNIAHIPNSTTSPLIPLPTNQAGEKLAYQMRLLSLWINQVKQTGQIDYPELVQLLDQVHEVENAPDGAVLMQQQCDALVQNLKRAQSDIREAAEAIQFHLNELSGALKDGTLGNTEEKELRSHIREKTQQFLQGVEYLLDVTQHHVYQPSQPWKKWMRRTEDTEAETVRKWMNDLNYIRQYIAQQAQVGVLAGNFPTGNSKTPDFRRLHKYLENAPGFGDLLGNFVQRALSHKVAGGGKFGIPKGY